MEPERAREGQERGEKGPKSIVLLMAEAVLCRLLSSPPISFRAFSFSSLTLPSKPRRSLCSMQAEVMSSCTQALPLVLDLQGPSSTPASISMTGWSVLLALGSAP